MTRKLTLTERVACAWLGVPGTEHALRIAGNSTPGLYKKAMEQSRRIIRMVREEDRKAGKR